VLAVELWSRGRAILHYRMLAVLAVEQREGKFNVIEC